MFVMVFVVETLEFLWWFVLFFFSREDSLWFGFSDFTTTPNVSQI